jgi:predicted permease
MIWRWKCIANSLDGRLLGPLILVAFIYEALGMLLAWIVSQIFWVPHQFRFGILVAGGWANIGDIRMFHSFMEFAA